MKKLEVNLLIAVVVITALLFSGCESKKDKLSVYPDELEFYVDDEDEIFVEVSSNAKWSASTTAKWIYIDESADGFYVSVDANPGASRERTGKITVKAGEASSATITVTQLTTSVPGGGGGGAGSLKFTDIQKGTYLATGTPSFLTQPGPMSWTGTIEPQSSDQGQWYKLTTWGGVSCTVYLDFISGKIILDDETKVGDSNDNRNVYFGSGTINPSNKAYNEVNNYEVKYDKTTQTLDFTGTSSGRSIVVGLIGKNKTTNAIEAVYSDLYANVKLKLTFNSSSSPKNANDATKTAGNFLWSDSVTIEELKFTN